MHNDTALILPSTRQRICRIFLLISWLTGLAAGMIYAFHADPSFFSLMRSAAYSPVSIVGLLVVIFIPFLFSAIAVFISRPVLLIPLAFVKAFTFGACTFAMNLSFASAGWLLRLLLMFSDLAAAPLLLWFWLRCFETEPKKAPRDLAVCTVLSALIGSIDFCIVSPFLAMLL